MLIGKIRNQNILYSFIAVDTLITGFMTDTLAINWENNYCIYACHQILQKKEKMEKKPQIYFTKMFPVPSSVRRETRERERESGGEERNSVNE